MQVPAYQAVLNQILKRLIWNPGEWRVCSYLIFLLIIRVVQTILTPGNKMFFPFPISQDKYPLLMFCCKKRFNKLLIKKTKKENTLHIYEIFSFHPFLFFFSVFWSDTHWIKWFLVQVSIPAKACHQSLLRKEADHSEINITFFLPIST